MLQYRSFYTPIAYLYKMTTQQYFHFLRKELLAIYENREADSIAEMVIEKVTQQSRRQRIIDGDKALSSAAELQLKTYTDQLLQAVPVQYVLEEAWFSDMPFYVNTAVLIPRPETEELVEWVLRACEQLLSSGKQHLRITDIGTGSGCIPVSLKKRLPLLEVEAADISSAALAVAQKNATTAGTPIYFHQLDFREKSAWATLPVYDIIVSNPPYIPASEEGEMADHVTCHEPHLALFVPDTDPLLFYRLLGEFAAGHLSEGGQLFVEIHEQRGSEVVALFREQGFRDVELKSDMQQKARMVRAFRK